MNEYKYVIDKQQLYSYFMQDDKTPTAEQTKAIQMTITAILVKHYSGYLHLYDELSQEAFLAVMNHHGKYDPSFQAYSYVYAIVRNCCHNYIWKYSKETLVEEVLPLSNASTHQDLSGLVHLPSEIGRYKKFLDGTEKFDVINLPQRDAINLLAFCATYSNSKRVKVPDFIGDNPNAVSMLYNIMIKL